MMVTGADYLQGKNHGAWGHRAWSHLVASDLTDLVPVDSKTIQKGIRLLSIKTMFGVLNETFKLIRVNAANLPVTKSPPPKW